MCMYVLIFQYSVYIYFKPTFHSMSSRDAIWCHWLVTFSVPTTAWSKADSFVYNTPRNTSKWNCIWNSYICIQEAILGIVALKIQPLCRTNTGIHIIKIRRFYWWSYDHLSLLMSIPMLLRHLSTESVHRLYCAIVDHIGHIACPLVRLTIQGLRAQL